LSFQPSACVAALKPGTNAWQAGSEHCRNATVLPFAGAFGSCLVTPILIGGAVGGVGTLAAALVDVCDAEPEPLLELDFDSDPHAVRASDATATIAIAALEFLHPLIELSSTS
jgi:hypothetical protein